MKTKSLLEDDDEMQFEIFIMVSRDLLRYAGATEETIKDVFEKRGVRHE